MPGLIWALIGHSALISSLIGQHPGDVTSMSRAGKCHQNMKLESLVTGNSGIKHRSNRDADYAARQQADLKLSTSLLGLIIHV